MNEQGFHSPYLERMRDRRKICFAEAVRVANRALTRFYNERLGEVDIGIAQMALLIRLYYRPGIGVTRLAEQLDVDRTTLARNLRVLARAGHIEFGASGDDRRTRQVRLTARGFESMEAALPLWHEAQRQLEAALGAERWDQLLDGLQAVADLCGQPGDDQPEPRLPATSRRGA